MIYCIEGVHLARKERENRETEPTIEPMLELLQRTGYWDGYLHRTCATTAELRYRLCEEWNLCIPRGPSCTSSPAGLPTRSGFSIIRTRLKERQFKFRCSRSGSWTFEAALSTSAAAILSAMGQTLWSN